MLGRVCVCVYSTRCSMCVAERQTNDVYYTHCERAVSFLFIFIYWMRWLCGWMVTHLDGLRTTKKKPAKLLCLLHVLAIYRRKKNQCKDFVHVLKPGIIIDLHIGRVDTDTAYREHTCPHIETSIEKCQNSNEWWRTCRYLFRRFFFSVFETVSFKRHTRVSST